MKSTWKQREYLYAFTWAQRELFMQRGFFGLLPLAVCENEGGKNSASTIGDRRASIIYILWTDKLL